MNLYNDFPGENRSELVIEISFFSATNGAKQFYLILFSVSVFEFGFSLVNFYLTWRLQRSIKEASKNKIVAHCA